MPLLAITGSGVLITNFGFSTFTCLCILLNLLCALAVSIMELFLYRHQCIVKKLSNRQFHFCIFVCFFVSSSIVNAFVTLSSVDSSQWSEALKKVNPTAMDLLEIPNIYYFPYSKMVHILLFCIMSMTIFERITVPVLFLITPFLFLIIRCYDGTLGLQILNNVATMLVSNYGILATLFLIYFNDPYRKFLLETLRRKGVGFTFHQDNATIHATRSTETWLEENDVATLNWPSSSPDLSPMENL
uniref:G protein-coupled receptor n=1 Tax=Heterorhabditis bacteriophora TaxID=37862 RepID=A0A1I7XQ65_HETBA